MSKITLTDATTLTNETSFVASLNANYDTISAAFENTLSRDGTSPNSMGADLDMNSYRVTNLPVPLGATEPLRLQDLSDFIGNGTISITAGAPITASYVTLGTNATLTSERVLTAGTGITLVDGGVGSTLTVSTTQAPITTSASLAAILSDETGTGSVVFGTSPTFTTGITLNGTETITATGLGKGFNVIQAPTGTTTGAVSLNLITISPDTVITDSSSFVIGLNVGMQFGGSSVIGGREAIQGYAELTAATSSSNNNRNYVGIQGIATATHDDGGTNTGAGAKGALFGGSWFGYAQNTATNLLHVTGGEINFALQTGSSAKHKTGLLVCNHTSDNVQGATTDGGIVLSSQVNFGLNHGFLVSDMSGFFPIKSTGTIFGSVAGSATHGIDLSSVTLATTAFKSTGFSVDGSGNTTVNTLLRGAPVTKTADFTVAATENWLIVNKAGSTTVTLPAAASFTGREIHFKTIQAQTVVSNASNVVPNTTATAGTALIPATDGAWCTIVSDGTNWIIMASSTLV